jgi:hypothetical protein
MVAPMTDKSTDTKTHLDRIRATHALDLHAYYGRRSETLTDDEVTRWAVFAGKALESTATPSTEVRASLPSTKGVPSLAPGQGAVPNPPPPHAPAETKGTQGGGPAPAPAVKQCGHCGGDHDTPDLSRFHQILFENALPAGARMYPSVLLEIADQLKAMGYEVSMGLPGEKREKVAEKVGDGAPSRERPIKINGSGDGLKVPFAFLLELAGIASDPEAQPPSGFRISDVHPSPFRKFWMGLGSQSHPFRLGVGEHPHFDRALEDDMLRQSLGRIHREPRPWVFPFTDEKGQTIGRPLSSVAPRFSPEAAPHGTVFNIGDLETRVRPDTLLECFDWDRDGRVDEKVAKSFAADVEAWVMQRAKVYRAGARPKFSRKEEVQALQRVAVTYAMGLLGALYPNLYPVNHEFLIDQADDDLALIFGE